MNIRNKRFGLFGLKQENINLKVDNAEIKKENEKIKKELQNVKYTMEAIKKQRRKHNVIIYKKSKKMRVHY